DKKKIDIQGDEHMKSIYCSSIVDVWIRKRIMLMNDYAKGLVKSHYMNQGKITKGDTGNVKIKISMSQKPNNDENRRMFGVGQGDWNAVNDKQFTMGYKGKIEFYKRLYLDHVIGFKGVQMKHVTYMPIDRNRSNYELSVLRITKVSAIKGIMTVGNMNTE
ncbi:23305_t:CDS:2, partial [Gigaspora margarita]